MTLSFDYPKGVSHRLIKHPRVLADLKAGVITAEHAAIRPWYFRPSWRRSKPFKLAADDDCAIRAAKDILKGRTEKPEQFSEWLADQDRRKGITLGDLAAAWLAADCAFSDTETRTPAAAEQLRATLARALPWWQEHKPAAITRRDHAAYVVHRRANNRTHTNDPEVTNAGSRSADLELSCLSCLCQWAISAGRIKTNPFAERERFHKASAVQHCHQYAPTSAEELHQILAWFWNSTDLRQQVAGAWLAFTALTGLRPEEPAYLYRCARLDKSPAQPSSLPAGTIFPDRTGQLKMKITRTKHGQNPFITVHSVLNDFLTIYATWLDQHLPRPASDPWPAWFPNPQAVNDPVCPIGDTSYLNKRMALCCAALKLPARKPKGVGRAYYVAVRRSAGLDDATIAGELGQTTNGALIRSTYGDPDAMHGGALLDWLPLTADHKPAPAAWAVLQQPAKPACNIIEL